MVNPTYTDDVYKDQNGNEEVIASGGVLTVQLGGSIVTAGGTVINGNGLINESAQDGIVAHPGGGQANATPLTNEVNRVTTVATAGDSVMLDPSAPGLTVIVINAGARPMQVYGAGADTIDVVAAATGVSQMPGSSVIYTCITAGSWSTNGLATGYYGSLQTTSSQDNMAALAGGGQAGATLISTMVARFTTVASNGDSSLLPVTTEW